MEEFILKLAREAIETYVKTGKRIVVPNHPKELDEKKGVFVTLYTKPRKLRGCIGFPYPQLPLIDALISAAIEACNDPRFPKLLKRELKDITIEVSVLSKPELVKVKSPKDYLNVIKPGKDGLIIEKNYRSGLFLPQVWDEIPEKENFMEALCMKAGLMPDEWLDSSAKLYIFQVEAFIEC
ncbi:MAG: AmmeMemoRadiSam system protein A [Candidatus Aenigmatarchaeota archaeon]